MKKLKRAVIKEEFVALTGDVVEALILNQFLYWSERVDDIDQWIREENMRRAMANRDEIELNHGWIYKKTSELNDELMLNMSEVALRRKIKRLVERGFIQERRNPTHSWDRTLQYRVDLQKIRDALHEIGYELQGFRFLEKVRELRSRRSLIKKAPAENVDEELKRWVAERMKDLRMDLERIGFSRSSIQSLFEKFPLDRIVGFLIQMRKDGFGIKRPRAYLLSCLANKNAMPDIDWSEVMEVWLPAQFDSAYVSHLRMCPSEFFSHVLKWLKEV